MEEEFFATIKLVSGEEIICRTSFCAEDDVLLIHEPMQVEHVSHQKQRIKVQGFSLQEWIHSTFDDCFFIPKQHIVTMTECDKKITEFYLKCVSNEKKSKHLSQQMREGKHIGDPNKVIPGYVGSVENARESLEKIFKTS